MNALGDCDAFQYIQSFEIEPSGVMWFPDIGRELDISAEGKNKAAECPPKLVILDYFTQKILRVSRQAQRQSMHLSQCGQITYRSTHFP